MTSRLSRAKELVTFEASSPCLTTIGSQSVTEFFEKNYSANITIDSAITLALRALATVVEGGLDPSRIETAIIRKDTGKFDILPNDSLTKYIEQVKAAGNA